MSLTAWQLAEGVPRSENPADRDIVEDLGNPAVIFGEVPGQPG